LCCSLSKPNVPDFPSLIHAANGLAKKGLEKGLEKGLMRELARFRGVGSALRLPRLKNEAERYG
jgi:hypothetical protein